MKIQFQNKELILFESELFRTTATLLIGEEHLLLVDPNWLPSEVDFILEMVEKLRKEKELFLYFTHSDYDHIIGYKKFVSLTKTIASQNFIDSKSIESNLLQIREFDDQYYIKRDYEIEYPKIEIAISGNTETHIFGNEKYKFYQAIGHNADGLICLNQNRGILIVGDYLSNIEFPYIYESIAAYEKTLDTLEDILKTENIKVLITGHGDFTTSKIEMQQRLNDSRDYILKLKKSVLNDEPFPTLELFERYSFPIIMKKFHNENVKLAQKELKT